MILIHVQDATEVMQGFHSEKGMEMMKRLPKSHINQYTQIYTQIYIYIYIYLYMYICVYIHMYRHRYLHR